MFWLLFLSLGVNGRKLQELAIVRRLTHITEFVCAPIEYRFSGGNIFKKKYVDLSRALLELFHFVTRIMTECKRSVKVELKQKQLQRELTSVNFLYSSSILWAIQALCIQTSKPNYRGVTNSI